MRYVLAVAAIGLMGQAALAFQESTIGGGDAKAPALELPKAPADITKGLNLVTPGLHLGQTPGTEVKIPGLGTVGVIPKLDFGLELLYGANEQKGPLQDKTNPGDVQLRGTIKLPIN